MNKLSKREKSMLFVLGIVLMAAIAFMFVIQPIMTAAAENKSVINDLEMQLADARMAVAQESAINKRLDEAIGYANDEGRTFYRPMTTWDAERHVTKILHENKVMYDSVSIQNPVEFLDVAVGTEPAAPVDGATGTNGEADVVSTGIKVVTLSFHCVTPRDTFYNMLDDFAALEKKGCITNWDYTMDLYGTIDANLTVSLYSIE